MLRVTFRRLRTQVAVVTVLASAAVVAHVGGAVLTPGTPAAALGGGAGGRPNIVVVMADDMRADDLRFMPRLRRLVQRTGTDFENSFSPYPLCCPARASFLTGKAAHNHRVYWHEAPYGYGAFDDSVTLATALSKAGYRTGMVGKYLNKYGTARSKVSGRPSARYVPRGWDDWRAAVSRPRGASWSGGPYNFFNTPYNVNGEIDARHKGEYNTETIGAMTRDMVGGFQRSSRPFFVYSSFVAPHHGGPRESDDPRGVTNRDGEITPMPTTARPRWVRGRFDHQVLHPAGLPQAGGPSEPDVLDKPPGLFRDPEPNAREVRALTEVTRQRAEALYVLDREVGRTVEHLKRLGAWKNTVFVFTSDNGYYLGEHRKRSGKTTAHEPSLRVPLLMTGPGVPAGQSRFDPATTMDLTATVADLAGATEGFPYALEGESLLGPLRAGDQGWHRPVLTEALYGRADGRDHSWNVKGYPRFEDPRGSIGIRLARYKITVYHFGFVELYDLARDPNELDGVQKDPAYRGVKKAMLELWWRSKDCRAAECTASVPAALSTSPAETRSLTRYMFAERAARYGR